ncbi:MAG: RagB/SusD family nutrient uptake outer membrane protein [Saprospiraceae bacterium]|nr:RagB/SusD family nutrient uptake outer membrane protein [Saprospiraceae bacterium]MBK9727103.1 RagB/SusD family nutrient uptake outer membrane protein [Saprospiraceae bacterium]
MKQINLILFICLILVACDHKLDVNPTQEIDETTALKTAQDVKVTLIGAYDGISSENVFGGGFQFIPELLGDDREVIFGGTFTELSEVWRKTITTGNIIVWRSWQESYTAINRANNVLSAIDKLDESDKNKVEGEARFIRAIVYFGLVNLFAKTWGDGDNNINPGVPLVLTPTKVVTQNDFRPRASVAAVYTQIIEDLKIAEQKLPEQQAVENSGFALSTAATAFLSKVYLIQGNYTAALESSNAVIASGKHSLSTNFEALFVDESVGQINESIFKIIVTQQDGLNAMNTYYAPADFQGRGDIRIQNKHLELYETDDPRGTFFSEASMRHFTNKFNEAIGDVVVIRLAEMYFIRAECNFRLGLTTGASPLEDLNLIRDRAGAKPLLDTDINLDRILFDRKLELAFEGNLLQDLKRTQRKIGDLPYNDPSLILPIPQREMDTNKALTQNDGY